MSRHAHSAQAEQQEEQSQTVSLERVLRLLDKGRLTLEGLMPHASNYTFLATVNDASLQCRAIYKPQKGERPLWDFPQGTLCLREYAAFLVSTALGWNFVPPTVLRKGPHGLGAIQLFIDAVPDANFFTLRDAHAPLFQRLAAFDFVVNNADRKAGHCLLGKDGRVWAIDHGITFHADFKLRTVIWDWAGEPLPADIVADLQGLERRLASPDPLTVTLSRFLAQGEMDALRQRLAVLLETGRFPEPVPGTPNVPWPIV